MISLREVLRVVVDFVKLVPVMAVKPPQPEVAVSVASILRLRRRVMPTEI
jgi:hypothetical protein